MLKLSYEDNEIGENHDIAFERIERMIEEIDLSCEDSISIVYNYIRNYIKTFDIVDDNIYHLHQAIYKDLERVRSTL